MRNTAATRARDSFEKIRMNTVKRLIDIRSGPAAGLLAAGLLAAAACTSGGGGGGGGGSLQANLCAGVTCDEGEACDADTGVCEAATGTDTQPGADEGDSVSGEGDGTSDGEPADGTGAGGDVITGGEEAGPAGAGDPAIGQVLYRSNSCVTCHGLPGEGGAIGPDLSGRSTSALHAELTSPLHDGGMYHELTSQDYADLAAYLGGVVDVGDEPPDHDTHPPDSDDSSPDAEEEEAEETEGPVTLELEVDQLPALPEDSAYAVWLVVGGTPLSIGRFTLDDLGQPDPAELEVDSSVVEAATVVQVYLEADTGYSAEPASAPLLAGALVDGAAGLSVADSQALRGDFAEARGAYVLATPTTASREEDYAEGIWWPATPEPMLILPELPAGWIYEGWVVGPEGPISTGRFASPAGADDDGAGDLAGADDAPAAPGQDFVASYAATLEGAQISPDPVETAGGGEGSFVLDTTANTLSFHITYQNLDAELAAHIHGYAPRGENASILLALPLGEMKQGVFDYPEEEEENVIGGLLYAVVHSPAHPPGELRGQIEPAVVLGPSYAAWITIEPAEHDDPSPFGLKVLVDDVVEDVGNAVPQDMTNRSAGFPTVRVSVRE